MTLFWGYFTKYSCVTCIEFMRLPAAKLLSTHLNRVNTELQVCSRNTTSPKAHDECISLDTGKIKMSSA